MSIDFKSILDQAEHYRSDISRFLRDMIAIPSESGDEERVILRIKAEMEKVGFDRVEIDGMGNIYGFLGHGSHVIAMDAHIDTVGVGNPANWKVDPYQGFEDDDIIMGRGASDQEGGMASMVYAGKIIKDLGLENLTTLAPDIGSVPLSRSYAKLLDASLAIIDKRRPEHNKAEVMHLIGEVEGKNVLIMDDMIDTAGTMTAAAKKAREVGAKSVHAAVTHGVLSGPAIKRLVEAPIDKILVSDTIKIAADKKIEKLMTVSVAGVFGEAIKRIHNEESISVLFDI